MKSAIEVDEYNKLYSQNQPACDYSNNSVRFISLKLLTCLQNLYDMLLKLLEERGIDADFLDQVVEFSTSYEHRKYIELLEHLKDFANSK